MENSISKDPEDLASCCSANVGNKAANEKKWSDQGNDLKSISSKLEMFN